MEEGWSYIGHDGAYDILRHVDDDMYLVANPTSEYIVSPTDSGILWECQCKDFQERGAKNGEGCKHIQLLDKTLRKQAELQETIDKDIKKSADAGAKKMAADKKKGAKKKEDKTDYEKLDEKRTECDAIYGAMDREIRDGKREELLHDIGKRLIDAELFKEVYTDQLEKKLKNIYNAGLVTLINKYDEVGWDKFCELYKIEADKRPEMPAKKPDEPKLPPGPKPEGDKPQDEGEKLTPEQEAQINMVLEGKDPKERANRMQKAGTTEVIEETKETAMVPIAPADIVAGVVEPAMSLAEIKKSWADYQQLKKVLLDDSDFMFHVHYLRADGEKTKQFASRKGSEQFEDTMKKTCIDVWTVQRVKKSGCRKISRYFGLVPVITRQEKGYDDKGKFYALFEGYMKAPNGVQWPCRGYCSESEWTQQRPMHHIIGTAETRMVNRGTMDMVGFGDVTDEERGGGAEDE